MPLSGSAAAQENAALAAAQFQNVRLEAGEHLSFNQTVGLRTDESGYVQAEEPAYGQDISGIGGGVCQVCSTIYNIVLRVPAVIEDMNWHSQGGVSYLPAGFDATVSDTKDMVFRNVLPYDVRIEFESLDGVMTAFLFRDYDE